MADPIHIQVTGIDDVEATMQRVEAAIREPKLPQIWRAMLADLRDYPAPPPGSRYVRTGNLGRGWKIAFGQGRQATLFEAVNAVTYADWVQGERQATIHQGRWTKASAIVGKYETAIVDEWEAAIERAAQ